MKIEIKIDEGCTETKIIVVTSKVTERSQRIVKRLSSEQPQMIAAFKDDQAAMLDPTQNLSGLCIGGQGLCRDGKQYVSSPTAAIRGRATPCKMFLCAHIKRRNRQFEKGQGF